MTQETTESQRKRRYHTRSRTGCAQCKTRHIKCDEGRPFCANCLLLANGKVCQYPPAGQPVRERRMRQPQLPGEQEPWVVVWQPANTALDPFDAMSIRMPLKSRELFHYFASVRDILGESPFAPNCLAMVMLEADALRSNLLIAAMHYYWKVGGLDRFKSTYHLHRAESIRVVNKWIQDPRNRTSPICLKTIATLCAAESSLGDLAAAETHLDGLVALLDMSESDFKDVTSKEYEETELLERYVLVCMSEVLKRRRNMLHAPYSRSHNCVSATMGWLQASMVYTEQPNIDIFYQQQSDIQDRLIALCIVPYFFVERPMLVKAVDVRGPIDDLRALTELQQARGTLTIQEDSVNDCDACNVLLRGYGDSESQKYCSYHATTSKCDVTTSDLPELESSWCGMVTSGGLYLYSALGVWDKPQMLYERLLRSLLLILRRDLHQTRHSMSLGEHYPAFWFWKAFVGAFALAKAGEEDASFTIGTDKSLQTLRQYFDECIRTWSEVTGVNEWGKAKKILAKIVWPTDFKGELLAEEVWEDAVLR